METHIKKVTNEIIPDGLSGKNIVSRIVYFTETSGVRVIEKDNNYTIAPYNFTSDNIFIFDKRMKDNVDFLTECYIWVKGLTIDELKNMLKLFEM